MANYAGSNVLILGGGDGGVLKELLTLENLPNHVTMVELDEAVMTGCSKYMRSVCGKFLDEQYRLGSNYQVICGDAIQFMEKAKVCDALYKSRFHLIRECVSRLNLNV